MASAVASKAASKVSWLKPVFLMDILASTSASRKTVGPSPPPATSPAPEDDGVKDSTAAADPRPERDVRIPKLFAIRDGGAASMAGFSPRGWWVFKEDGDAVQLKEARYCRIGLSSQAFKTDQIRYMASSTASFRRCFSSGGAPPRSSFDDGVKDSTGEDSFFAALDFSDGEEPPKSDDESSDDDNPYRFRSPDFIVRLPHGAVWRVRDYPDSLKMKVAVPGMGKEIVMNMYWVYDDMSWLRGYAYIDQLMIGIQEVGKIEGKGDEDLEIDEYLETDEPPAGPGIYFKGDTYERERSRVMSRTG